MAESSAGISFSIHLDHGKVVTDAPEVAQQIAAILMRPCFAELSRLSARWKDRWRKHIKPTAELIAHYLVDRSNDSIYMDTTRSEELVASAEVENGVGRPSAPVPETRSLAYIVIPYVAKDMDAVVAATCDLAATLQAAAGFIALEPSYRLAHRVALPGSRPKERAGLSEQRFRERRGRGRYDDRLVAELAGVEWGTFLGSGHLPRINIDGIRRSGAFARVVQVTQALVYLQVTEDPMDGLTEGFEDQLLAARRALAPLLMDVSAMSLE